MSWSIAPSFKCQFPVFDITIGLFIVSNNLTFIILFNFMKIIQVSLINLFDLNGYANVILGILQS